MAGSAVELEESRVGIEAKTTNFEQEEGVEVDIEEEKHNGDSSMVENGELKVESEGIAGKEGAFVQESGDGDDKIEEKREDVDLVEERLNADSCGKHNGDSSMVENGELKVESEGIAGKEGAFVEESGDGDDKIEGKREDVDLVEEWSNAGNCEEVKFDLEEEQNITGRNGNFLMLQNGELMLENKEVAGKEDISVEEKAEEGDREKLDERGNDDSLMVAVNGELQEEEEEASVVDRGGNDGKIEETEESENPVERRLNEVEVDIEEEKQNGDSSMVENGELMVESEGIVGKEGAFVEESGDGDDKIEEKREDVDLVEERSIADNCEEVKVDLEEEQNITGRNGDFSMPQNGELMPENKEVAGKEDIAVEEKAEEGGRGEEFDVDVDATGKVEEIDKEENLVVEEEKEDIGVDDNDLGSSEVEEKRGMQALIVGEEDKEAGLPHIEEHAESESQPEMESGDDNEYIKEESENVVPETHVEESASHEELKQQPSSEKTINVEESELSVEVEQKLSFDGDALTNESADQLENDNTNSAAEISGGSLEYELNHDKDLGSSEVEEKRDMQALIVGEEDKEAGLPHIEEHAESESQPEMESGDDNEYIEEESENVVPETHGEESASHEVLKQQPSSEKTINVGESELSVEVGQKLSFDGDALTNESAEQLENDNMKSAAEISGGSLEYELNHDKDLGSSEVEEKRDIQALIVGEEDKEAGLPHIEEHAESESQPEMESGDDNEYIKEESENVVPETHVEESASHEELKQQPSSEKTINVEESELSVEVEQKLSFDGDALTNESADQLENDNTNSAAEISGGSLEYELNHDKDLGSSEVEEKRDMQALIVGEEDKEAGLPHIEEHAERESQPEMESGDDKEDIKEESENVVPETYEELKQQPSSEKTINVEESELSVEVEQKLSFDGDALTNESADQLENDNTKSAAEISGGSLEYELNHDKDLGSSEVEEKRDMQALIVGEEDKEAGLPHIEEHAERESQPEMESGDDKEDIKEESENVVPETYEELKQQPSSEKTINVEESELSVEVEQKLSFDGDALTNESADQLENDNTKSAAEISGGSLEYELNHDKDLGSSEVEEKRDMQALIVGEEDKEAGLPHIEEHTESESQPEMESGDDNEYVKEESENVVLETHIEESASHKELKQQPSKEKTLNVEESELGDALTNESADQLENDNTNSAAEISGGSSEYELNQEAINIRFGSFEGPLKLHLAGKEFVEEINDSTDYKNVEVELVNRETVPSESNIDITSEDKTENKCMVSSIEGGQCTNKDDEGLGRKATQVAEMIQAPPEARVVEKQFVYMIKVPRIIDDELQKEIRHAKSIVDEKTQIRDSISAEKREQLSIVKESSLEYNAELAKKKDAHAACMLKRQELEKVLEKLDKLNNANSIADIAEKIRRLKHRQQHETISLKQEKQYVQEINRLTHLREQLSLKQVPQEQIDEALNQRDEVEAQLKKLKKELESLKAALSSAESNSKSAWNKHMAEQQRLNSLKEKYNAADGARQKAYQQLTKLRNQLAEKARHFQNYKFACLAVDSYKLSGDNEGLISYCNSQVEGFFDLWNNDKEFRDQYVKSNTYSTLKRLETLDGRSLGPGEERPIFRPYGDKSLSNTEPAPVTASEVSKGNLTEPSTTKQLARTNQSAKVKSSTKPAFAEDIVHRGSISGKSKEEGERENKHKKEEEMARKAEELARKEVELRMEKEAAELKERLRLEQRAKAREAEERKRRRAEKAQARAEYRLQKEAELIEKKKAKKEKKKAGLAVNVANEDIEVPNTSIPDTNPPQTSQEPETLPRPASKGRSSRPATLTRKHNRVQDPIPLPLRNRSKRKMTTWMRALLVLLLVLLFFFAGNYISFSTSGLLSFGF